MYCFVLGLYYVACNVSAKQKCSDICRSTLHGVGLVQIDGVAIATDCSQQAYVYD